jgi:2-oxoglutarate dehydrogenase E2 component (dihydrolipoamide succinyltransferase)
MLVPIQIPQVSKEAEALVTVAAWFKSPGDNIEADEPIVELLFDKAAFDLGAPFSGRLHQIVIPEHGTGRQGDTLAYAEVND